MKVAILGTRGFPNVQGGVETHCKNLYPHLAKRDCEVAAFTRKPYVDYTFECYKGVNLVSLACPKNKYFEAFFHTLYGVFVAKKKIQPDILHFHGIGPSLFVPLARALGMKVVITNHGPDYQREKWGKFASIVLKLGEYIGSKWAHEIICVSKHIAENINKRYKEKVTIIPNGVCITPIANGEDTIKKYTLCKGKYILSVGRLVLEKGFHYLVEAFNAARLSDWKLVIVGKADHEDRYSLELKEKASKNDNIILAGFLTGESLNALYRHAGLFVLPSYYEGLPLVLLEAMSFGISCIVSDIPANRNVELSEERFFEAGNTPELVMKIKKYVNKPLSTNERTRQINMIAGKYDWENIAFRTLEVYRKVIG